MTCHDFWRERYRCREAPASDLNEDGQRLLKNALASRLAREIRTSGKRQ